MIRKFFFFFFIALTFLFELYFSITGILLFLFEGFLLSAVLALFFGLFEKYRHIPIKKRIFHIFLSFSAFF